MTATATFFTGPPEYDGDFQVCLTEVLAHPPKAKAKTATEIESIVLIFTPEPARSDAFLKRRADFFDAPG
jgi:hypothetical protein